MPPDQPNTPALSSRIKTWTQKRIKKILKKPDQNLQKKGGGG